MILVKGFQLIVVRIKHQSQRHKCWDIAEHANKLADRHEYLARFTWSGYHIKRARVLRQRADRLFKVAPSL